MHGVSGEPAPLHGPLCPAGSAGRQERGSAPLPRGCPGKGDVSLHCRLHQKVNSTHCMLPHGPRYQREPLCVCVITRGKTDFFIGTPLHEF